MAISRELTQKLKRDSDDEDEEDEDEILQNDKEDNNLKTESEIDDFIKNYRRYWDEKNQKKEEKKEEKKEGKDIKILNEVILEKKDIKLCRNKIQCKAIKEKSNEKNNETLQENASKNANVEIEKPCDTVGSTSAWHVGERNDKTENKLCNNKKNRSQNIDEMFDSMEEKLKHKVNLKLQKVKNKLKTKNDVKKHEKEEKEDEEDDLSKLEFQNSKQKPILDCPLEETTSRENEQVEKNLTSLKPIANTEQEPTSNSQEVEIDPQKYLNIKPKYLRTQMPDVATGEEENSDQEEKMRKIMSEAFADDDVVEEFRKEQEEEVCNKDIKKLYKI